MCDMVDEPAKIIYTLNSVVLPGNSSGSASDRKIIVKIVTDRRYRNVAGMYPNLMFTLYIPM